jgi:hypothetical protein
VFEKWWLPNSACWRLGLCRFEEVHVVLGGPSVGGKKVFGRWSKLGMTDFVLINPNTAILTTVAEIVRARKLIRGLVE